MIIEERSKFGRAGKTKPLRLDDLAKSVGLSTFHFHRSFKATTQVTPGDFIQACRALAIQDALGRDRGVEIDAAQFVKGSSQWSPRTSRKALGSILPTEYAKGASSVDIEYCSIVTPAGSICAAYSMRENEPEATIHAVLLGPDAENRARLRFPDAKFSESGKDCLQRCVSSLVQEAQDRDTELTPDVLSMLWRARIWLRLNLFWVT